MKELQGRIIKGIGGFYYVDAAGQIYTCRARGGFRKGGITPLVGDLVTIGVDEADNTGWVDSIFPRKNQLLRPPVSNVTQIAIVIATASPRPNLLLLDKLIAAAELAEISPLICWNKADLESGEDYARLYQNAGFETFLLSADTGQNINQLKEKLRNQITVFAGNSGVGKSSLLNCILGNELFETGQVSNRVERGKHTTRHTELVPLPDGGYLIDSPGFGSFDLSLLTPDNLCSLFREMAPFADSCLFRDCSHTVEKGCNVLEAVGRGKIAKSRHENYCTLWNEIKNSDKRK